MEIVILGCGSSGGVPRADGNFGVCDPEDRRNWRTRCSLLVRRPNTGEDGEGGDTTLVVDASPEFRQQTAAGVGAVAALGVCTYPPENGYFSFRRTTHAGGGDYGRQISAIVLTG